MWSETPHLQLDFSHCRLGDAGARAVAEHLPPCLTQLSLDFGGCDIEPDEYRALEEMILGTSSNDSTALLDFAEFIIERNSRDLG